MDDDERAFRQQELDLRHRELGHQRLGVLVATSATVISLVIAVAAVVASVVAYQAAQTANKAVDKSAREQRISTGIEAMGADRPAQRIAGLGLLGRSVGSELDRVADDDPDDALDDEQRDARAAYLATIDAFENYLGSSEPAGPAMRSGDPTAVPKDVLYAFNELLRLIDGERADAARSIEAVPAVDLRGASLPGVFAEGADVGWMTFYAPGVDLRSARLKETTWGSADLASADLACARLYGAGFVEADGTGAVLTDADLRGANLMASDLHGVSLDRADLRAADLRDADLRGADLTGARLRGADLSGADLAGAVLAGVRGLDRANGLARGPVAEQLWDEADCLDRIPAG